MVSYLFGLLQNIHTIANLQLVFFTLFVELVYAISLLVYYLNKCKVCSQPPKIHLGKVFRFY